MNELIKTLKKIDYDKILDAIINDKCYYEDMYESPKDRPNLLDIPEYKQIDEDLMGILGSLQHNNQSDIIVYEQNERHKNSFCHVAINRKFQEEGRPNQFRIYLSPNDEHLYNIVYELLRLSHKEKNSIYLKYGRQNTLDKVIIYVLDDIDLKEKLKLIKKIKEAYPQCFESMNHPLPWISESDINGVYIAPEHGVKQFNGRDIPSYGVLMETVLTETKDLLLYCFKITKDSKIQLKNIPREVLMKELKKIFLQTLGKYRALTYIDKQENKVKYIEGSNTPKLGEAVKEKYIYDYNNGILSVVIKDKDVYKTYELSLNEDLLKLSYDSEPKYIENEGEYFHRIFYGK